MKIHLAIVKKASDIALLPEDKKPCYFLVADEANPEVKPQLNYLARYKEPVQLPFDYTSFKSKVDLAENINTFMAGDEKIVIKILTGPQKQDIEALTNYIPPTYDQERLVKRINLYLAANKLELKANEAGICQGLAALYCKYASQKDKVKFFALLEQISMQDSAALQENASEINLFIQEVIYAYRPEVFTKNSGQSYTLENVRVQNPNKEDKNSPTNRLKPVFKFNACATENQWLKIMASIKVENGNYLLRIPGHALSLSFVDGKFNYYDPNASEGEIIFNSEKEVLRKIALTIAQIQMDKATAKPGQQVKLPTTEGVIEIKYENDKWYIQTPTETKTFDSKTSRKELQDYVINNYIKTNKFMIDLALNVVENPYFPNHNFSAPNKTELLDELRSSNGEYLLFETLQYAVLTNDADLADEFLNDLVDPHNTQLNHMFRIAFMYNSHAWLSKTLDHPRSQIGNIQQKFLELLNDIPDCLGNDVSLEKLLTHPSFANVKIEKSWLYAAVIVGNSSSVTLLLNLCKKEELASFVDEELVLNAAKSGKIEIVEQLLPYQTVNEELAQSCVLAALRKTDLKMAQYLIDKFPEYKLLRTLHLQPLETTEKEALLNKALIARNESYVKLVTLMCSKEEATAVINDGVIFEAIRGGHSNSLDILLNKRAVDKGTYLKIYEYGTNHELSKLRPTPQEPVNAAIVNFLAHQIADKKIDALSLFKEMLSTNDTILARAVIAALHTQKDHLPAHDAIQHFMEAMIQQKNNVVLHELLQLTPQLPLDYVKLYQLAKKVDDEYQTSRWPGFTFVFSMVPDATVLAKLKLAAELSPSFNCSTTTMLKIQAENPVEPKVSEKSEPHISESKKESATIIELSTTDKVKSDNEEPAPSSLGMK